MIDNRTTNLELLLPNVDNDLTDDVQRISESFDILDGAIHDIIENGSFPDQSGKAGQFLKTDGENVLWDDADSFPDQTNNAGKFLRTNGIDVMWDEVKQKSPVDYVDFFNLKYGVNEDDKMAWEFMANQLAERLDALEKRTEQLSGHGLLETFYTFRTDPAPLNGAYDCNGAEFSRGDFVGEHNPYDLLVMGYGKTCTYAEYNAELADKGSCAKFGLDTSRQKFKVPTLTNILQPTILASAIAEICDAGLPNITGDVVSRGYGINNIECSGAFKAGTATSSSLGGTNIGGHKIAFDASLSSTIYRDDINTVQPQTIYIRAMVQLATAGQEISIEQYEQQLSQYAQTAMINGRILGETIESLVPLTDVGIHLFDGSAIQKSGIYAKFTNYIENLEATTPEMFVTQAEFDASVNAYGVCSKFVNGDSYIRLPKLYSETRYLVKAWRSGVNGYDLYSDGWCEQWGETTSTGVETTYSLHVEFADMNYFVKSSMDGLTNETGNAHTNYFASNRISTTQFKMGAYSAGFLLRWWAKGYVKETPDSEKTYRYICVATAVKEPTEVVIDNVITDLNNKADKDFANVTKPYVVEEWHEGTEWYRVWSTGFIEQGGQKNNLNVNAQNELLTFNYEFSNTDYKVLAEDIAQSAVWQGGARRIFWNKTTKTVNFATQYTNGIMWRAEGY